MNRAEEDYLKAIYSLKESNPSLTYISNKEIADYFDHTLQSVNEMIKKLVKQELVEYKPYKGSILTDRGKQLAERMIRVHRIWETFLVEKLGYQWEEVHQEAEVLEHITSLKLEERLFDFLEHPSKCPHGNPISYRENSLSQEKNISLLNIEKNKEYRISKLVDKDEVLRAMNKLALKLDDVIVLDTYDNINENLILRKDGQKLYIGFKVAAYIYVKTNN